MKVGIFAVVKLQMILILCPLVYYDWVFYDVAVVVLLGCSVKGIECLWGNPVVRIDKYQPFALSFLYSGITRG